MTGLPIDRCLAVRHEEWLARVIEPDCHWHATVSTRTWKVEPETENPYIGCWSSCSELALPLAIAVRPA